MADIIKIMKDGVVQYPITKPECVIDENGKNVLQLIRENAGDPYDDTELRQEVAELSEANEVLKEAQQFTDVAIKDLQDMKIDRENDDYYPKMAVGLADNLAGVDVVDSEINFRRSGGGAITDGVARIETIKGNSVVWNQCFKRGASDAGTWDGNMLTINKAYSSALTTYDIGTYAAEYVGAIANHKYYIGIEIVSGTIVGDLTYVVYPAKVYTSVVLNNSNKAYQAIISQLNNNQYWFVRTYSAGSEYTNVKVRHVVRDLTKMFGAGNEPTTIEEFYARIPMGVDMNAYNEGEVIHMDVQSIESVGVNAWDEEWEIGGLSANGLPVEATNRIRSKNYIPVVPHKTYYVSKALVVFYYDIDYNIISYEAIAAGVPPIPSNCYYLKFYEYGTTTYKGDICINLSDTAINGKYFPYIKRVEDLAVIRKYFPQGMKSARTAHDEIRYNKTTQKWEKVVRIMKADAGTLAWAQDTYNGKTIFKAYIAEAKGSSSQATKGAILCPRYSAITAAGIDTQDKSIASYYVAAGYECQVRVYDSAYTDLASFKNGVSGLDIYVEMLEPIVTELDEADQFKDLDYQVWNAGTEKAIAEGKSAPLAADITYGFNAIGKIKELESLVAALRAKVGI